MVRLVAFGCTAARRVWGGRASVLVLACLGQAVADTPQLFIHDVRSFS